MRSSQSSFLKTAVDAALLGGRILMEQHARLLRTDVVEKTAFDFVTEVDHLSEREIVALLRNRFPAHGILAEESGKASSDSEFCWVIDPLDGTKNYIHKIPQFCVSVALKQGDEIIAGAVYDPCRAELFSAEQGQGAFLNDARISVSAADDLSECLIATAFPFKAREVLPDYYQAFSSLFGKISDFRRAGSAALDLAYVACGRLDGYWELGLKPWDIAAGALFVREAGGMVTDLWGGDTWFRTGHLLACNGNIHARVVELLSPHLTGDSLDKHLR